MNRNQSKIDRLKRQPKLRADAKPSQLIYIGAHLYRKQVIELLTGGYLYKHQNILVTGPTGTGKTYIGYAFEPVPAINRNHLTLPTDFLEHSIVERLDGNAQKQL